MSDLSRIEKIKLEKLFGMGTGYVLDFTDRTFEDFIFDTVRIEIYDDKYKFKSGSKANRLRALWQEESNYRVGKVTKALLVEYITVCEKKHGEVPYEERDLYTACGEVADRLLTDSLVTEVDAFADDTGDADFNMLARQIKESIEKNEPEAALDRLHTFLTKFIRQLCEKHAIEFSKAESLNSIFGRYVRFLVNHDAFESAMAEKILKYSINVLDAFNTVRNDQSFAHDNPVLNYSESVLIFNNVASSIKFIQTLEDKVFRAIAASTAERSTDVDDEDLPF